jgi:glucose-6-phosphate isomerase
VAVTDFATKIRSDAWKGHPGRPIRNIINNAIGGSDHRPVMAYEALRRYTESNLTLRFVSTWTRRTSQKPPGTCQQKKRSTSCSARWPNQWDRCL